MTTHLKPRSDDPSEWMNARIFALAHLLRLLVFWRRQLRAEFRIDSCSILNWMGIVERSGIKAHADGLFYAHASAARC